jgi:hypothetical protein
MVAPHFPLAALLWPQRAEAAKIADGAPNAIDTVGPIALG